MSFIIQAIELENYGNIQIGRKISEFQYLKFNVPDGEKIGGEGNV